MTSQTAPRLPAFAQQSAGLVTLCSMAMLLTAGCDAGQPGPAGGEAPPAGESAPRQGTLEGLDDAIAVFLRDKVDDELKMQLDDYPGVARADATSLEVL